MHGNGDSNGAARGPRPATMADWLAYCRDRLAVAGLHFGHGTDNALDEAAWLVLHAAGRPVDGRFGDWNLPVDQTVGDEIRRLLRERIDSGRPLAYVLGEAWFCGLRFEVTPNVLVPRSPLAELIADGFRPWLPPRGHGRALDLCTGSGCIAVATAAHLPGWTVDASDLSDAALAVARRNVAAHRLDRRVFLHRSDLFDTLPGAPWDLIVSNPPYVPAAAIDALPREYRAEPALGLASGEDGLDLPLRILAGAPDRLARYGVLVCEVGESWQRLQDALPGVAFTWIEFEHGGEGVFTMDRDQLTDARPAVLARLESRQE